MNKKEVVTKKKSGRTVQTRLNKEREERFKTLPGKNDSERIRGLIDGGYYLNMPEMAAAVVELKDAMHSLENDVENNTNSFGRMKKAVNYVCQLLSTN